MMQSSNRLSSAKGPPPSARPVASSDPSQHPHQHRHRHRQLGTAAVVAGGSRSAAQAGSSRCQQVKCVFVGDGAIGKTSLIVSYTTNGYPAEYVPTAFDTYSVVVTIDNKPCQLQLCDTAGQDDFDSIRPLCYKHTDVFMVCFSVVSPGSFASIRSKWLPEIRRSLQKQAGSDQQAIPPFILVGTQCDLRHDVKVLIELDAAGQQPISSDYARAMAAKFGAMSYIECSALTQKNLKEVFDTAILAALDYRNQVKKKSTPSIITANGGCSSPLASRSPRLANNASADHSTPAVAKTTVAGGHSKSNGSKLSETSGHSVPGSPPPLPLSPHPTRHHFVPIERTKAAKISDARLVGWRKSLTKLSAQEALESEAAAAAAATADDYESFHYLPPPPPPQSAQPVASTSCSTSNSTTSPSSPNNYQTIVRSRRSNCNGNVATGNSGANAALLTSDLDDDQGFHDDEDDEEDEEDEDGEEDTAEVESASFSDDQACLSGGQKSNCHYYYHHGPNSTGNPQPAVLPQQSSQSRAKYGPVGLRSGLKGGGGSGSQATYYYYRAPPPPVPSPPYNDPYRADYHFQQASPALAARLLPLPPQPMPLPVVASQRPPSKLQSFFNFSRPTSDNHPKVAGNTGGGGGIFSGHQTNLNTTLRSSSFFFLASNAYKKTVDEKPAKAKSKKAVSKSHSTSSSTNTCTTTSSSSSSSSSTSSTMSNSLFKSPSHGGAHHHPHNAGLGSALYRSEIFQIMSNSVTELRNRKSLLKKFTLSSSNSSRSSSRRSSANSVSEKTKLKAKKLKELYYYDEDDYEEIDEGKGRRKCLFSCCFPFRR